MVAAQSDGINAKQPIKVMVVGEILYHYRRDVFKQLESNPSLDVEFIAGTATRDGSIVAVPPTEFNVVHVVTNHYFHGVLWQAGLLAAIRSTRPDAVIFLGDPHYASTWAAAAYCRARGIQVLFWTIGWSQPDKRLKSKFRLAYYRLADQLLLYGDIGRRLGAAAGFPASRMTVIYNSSSVPAGDLDREISAEWLQSLPPADMEVATAVIRLNANKRLDLLIRAAAILNGAGRPLSVLLVGDGPEKLRLQALARDLGVDLYLPGALYSTSQLDAVYARTTVSVIPAFSGLTTLQSFRYGIPVITHDNDFEQVPEAESIVHHVTGSRYRHGDVESLAHEITFWLDRQRESRLETAEECRLVVSSTWSAHAQAGRIVQALSGRFPALLHSQAAVDPAGEAQEASGRAAPATTERSGHG